MASTYSLKLIGKNNKLIDRQSVKLAAGKFVGPVVVKAQADVMYYLSAENNAPTLDKITAKKVGENLHIAFLENDIKAPDLVIEDYFEFNATVNLATSNLAGELVEFSQSGFLSSSSAVPTDATVATTLSAPGVTTSWYSNPLAQLALVGGGIAVVAASKKSGSDTPASTDATKGIGKILAYRGDATKKPGISDYSEGGVTGVTSDNVEAVNTAVAASTADTKDKVQNIVTVYAKILSKANGTAADTTTDDPTVADYKALGVELLGAAVNTKQLALLNDIIKTRTRTEVDDVKELNALANTVNKIFINASAGQGATTAITGTEFSNIGIYDTSPNAADKKALDTNQATALSDAIRRRGVDSSNTLGDIKAINTAYLKILGMADGKKDNTTSLPELPDFVAIGADKGPTNKGKAFTNGDPQQVAALKLLNTSIDGLTADKVNTLAQLDNMNKVIDKVMSIAIASAADAATVITTQDLTFPDLGLLGLTGATKDNVKFIASAIQAAAAITGTPAYDTSKVDELKELQSLVDVGVVMAYADTSTTYASTDTRRVPAHTAPTLENLKSAGVVAQDEGANKAIKNTGAIQSAINAVADPNKVNTKDELQTIVNTYDKLLTMADYVPNVSDKTNFTDVGKRMTQADYRTIGALNYGPTALTLDPTKFSSDNVSKAAKASATAATTSTPTVNDSALNLLNNVVDNLSTTAVDSIEKVNTLALTIDKIFAIANGDVNLGTSVGTGATALVASDLTALGLDSMSTTNAAYLKLVAKGLEATVKAPTAGQKDLVSTVDYTKIDTLQELQSAVHLGVVMAYADTSPNITPLPTTSHTAPTLANYTSLGVVKTDTTLNKAISDVDAINSAVEALATSAKVDTLFEIQNIVNIYSRVLKMADGSRVGSGITPAHTDATTGSPALGKLTAQEYKDLGALAYDVDGLYNAANSVSRVAGTGATNGSALNLLNDLIDGSGLYSVNSIKEINDLSRLVDKVMDTADGNGISKPLTLADLSTLGVTNIPSNTDTAFLTALETNIIGSHVNGDQVDTVQELQAWATLATAQRYAQLNGDSTAGAVAPSLESYQTLGNSGIIDGFKDTSGNTKVVWTNSLAIAVNSALLPLDASLSGVDLKNISISFQNILNEAQSSSFDGTPSTNPNKTDYQSIGVVGFENMDISGLNLMNDIVRNASQSTIDDLGTLKNFSTLITKIQALVDEAASGTWNTTATVNTDLRLSDFSSLGLVMTNSSGNTLTTSQFSSFLFQIAKATDHASFDSLSEFKQLLNSSAVLNV